MVVQLVQLLCRTVKLGWFDHDSHRTIVDDCKVLLEKNSPAHYIMGLRILNTLVMVRRSACLGGTWGHARAGACEAAWQHAAQGPRLKLKAPSALAQPSTPMQLMPVRVPCRR